MMGTNKAIRNVAAAICVGLLIGANAAAAGESAAEDASPCVWVIAVDQTAPLMRLGLDLAGRLAMQAPAGCRVTIRWINAASYRREALVGSFVVPREAPACSNPFDRRCKAEAQQVAVRAAATRRRFLERIRSDDAKPAARTDICGAVQSAADMFEVAQEGERRLFLVTALRCNVDHTIGPEVPGIEVIVLHDNDADPQTTLALRQKWRQRFEEWGAARVEFRAFEGVR